MLLNALRPHGGPHSLRLFCRCNWPTLRCLLFDLFDLFHNVQGQARCGRATVKLGELRKLIRKVLQRFLSAFHGRDPSPSQLVLARQRQKAHGGGHQRATLRSIERKCKVHFVSLRFTSNLCFFKYFKALFSGASSAFWTCFGAPTMFITLDASSKGWPPCRGDASAVQLVHHELRRDAHCRHKELRAHLLNCKRSPYIPL